MAPLILIATFPRLSKVFFRSSPTSQFIFVFTTLASSLKWKMSKRYKNPARIQEGTTWSNKFFDYLWKNWRLLHHFRGNSKLLNFSVFLEEAWSVMFVLFLYIYTELLNRINIKVSKAILLIFNLFHHNVYRQADWPGTDPGFPAGGGTNPRGVGCQYAILPNFPKNCMKMRKFWAVGGRAPRAPP